MAKALVAFGGNLAESPRAIERAIEELRQSGRILNVSQSIATAAVGKLAGNDFLNGALQLETPLAASELLQELHLIESQLGRERPFRWAPRIIDLDLLSFDQVVIDSPALVLPHPAMWYRRFVLQPLAEIAPECVHPVTGLSVSQLLLRTTQSPLVLEVDCTALSLVDDLNRIGLSDTRFVPAVGDDMDPAAAFARIRFGTAPYDKTRTQPPNDKPFVIVVPAETAGENLLQSRLRRVQEIVMSIKGC